MQLGVRAVGVAQAQARLAAVGAGVEPVLRGSLNTTATKGRTERYVRPMANSIKAARLRSALKIKRANSRLLNSRIIPSSSGIPVINYKTWGFDPIDATRGRIWVAGPRGRKVAAGFVNPASANRLPLSTRSSKTKGTKSYDYKRALQLAQGLSAAYWFKQLSDAETIRWFNSFLQQEFNKRVRREIAKRS
jgi:hypothetical protein